MATSRIPKSIKGEINLTNATPHSSPTKKKILQADLALLLASAIYGSSYPVLKVSLGEIPTLTLLGWRFLLAGIIIGLLFRKRLFPIKLDELRAGVITGFFWFGGFYFFASGIKYTEASRSGFIVCLFVLLVPFMTAILERRWPNGKIVQGAAVAVIGLGVMSLSSLNFSIGDILILVSTLFFGAQIVATEIFVKGKSAINLVFYQLIPCGIAFCLLALWLDPPVQQLSPVSIGGVLYLAIMPSALGLLTQTWGQKHTTADHAAVINASQPVFTAIFSSLTLGEILGPRTVIGGALILVGMLWAELGPGKLGSKDKSSAYEIDLDDKT